ncbi:MAG: SPOR domain-containing protein [Opitutae bacterium]
MANISKPVGKSENFAYNSFNNEHEKRVETIIDELKKAGSSCVVCSPNQDLRNHYLREIVSNLFDDPRNSTVMRAPNDRESIVSAISLKIDESSSNQFYGATRTLWIFEADFADDVDKISLISKLVRQFKSSGISMLVNCSGVVQRSQQFNHWIEKAKVRSEEFFVPTDDQISEFLNRADLEGGIYAARDLVSQLANEKEPTNKQKLEVDKSASKASEEIEADILSIALESASLLEGRHVEGGKSGKSADSADPEGDKDRSSEPRSNSRIASMLVAFSLSALSVLFVWLFFGKEITTSYDDFQSALAATVGVSGGELSNSSFDDFENVMLSPPLAETDSGLNYLDLQSSRTNERKDSQKGNSLTDSVESTLSSVVSSGVVMETSVVGSSEKMFFVLAGAFSNRYNAQRFITSSVKDPNQYKVLQKDSGLWAVVIGPLDRSEAEDLMRKKNSEPLVLVKEGEYQLVSQERVSPNER